MKQTFLNRIKRFGRNEDGQMIIEFALGVPLIFTLFMTSVEMGIYSMRQVFLDRGVDMTVRNIRLNTGANYSHTNLKQMICDYSGLPNDCINTMRLSMNPIDIRNFSGFGGSADCVDLSQPVSPLQTFSNGLDHEVMLLRACYMFKPVFPTSGLGHSFTKDGSGRVKMVSVSSFVQEPQ